MPDLERVRQWLKSTWKLAVPEDWLSACVEWINSEHQANRLTFDLLCNLVFDQWLISDLKEIGSSCLPVNLSQAPKHLLQGVFVLQINSMVDVSCPLYGQLQKLKGTLNENALVSALTQQSQYNNTQHQRQHLNNNKASRMLLLSLTDGVCDIKAIEHSPVSSLNDQLPIGTKMLVHGKIVCRMGVLLLKQENVTVLGGEVEVEDESGRGDGGVGDGEGSNGVVDVNKQKTTLVERFLHTNISNVITHDIAKMTFPNPTILSYNQPTKPYNNNNNNNKYHNNNYKIHKNINHKNNNDHADFNDPDDDDEIMMMMTTIDDDNNNNNNNLITANNNKNNNNQATKRIRLNEDFNTTSTTSNNNNNNNHIKNNKNININNINNINNNNNNDDINDLSNDLFEDANSFMEVNDDDIIIGNTRGDNNNNNNNNNNLFNNTNNNNVSNNESIVSNDSNLPSSSNSQHNNNNDKNNNKNNINNKAFIVPYRVNNNTTIINNNTTTTSTSINNTTTINNNSTTTTNNTTTTNTTNNTTTTNTTNNTTTTNTTNNTTTTNTTNNTTTTNTTNLHSLLLSPRVGIYSVKAHVSQVLGKLSFNGGRCWSLKVELRSDGEDEKEEDVVVVDMTNELIARLMAFEAAHFKNLKKEEKSNELIRANTEKFMLELFELTQFELQITQLNNNNNVNNNINNNNNVNNNNVSIITTKGEERGVICKYVVSLRDAK